MHFICYTGNDCDWNYASQVINRFKTVNYQPLYDSLATLLYNNMGNRVSQCYESNNPMNCTYGTCSSILNGDVSFSRTCRPNIALVSSIDIYRVGSFANSLSDVQDGFSFSCNRDLCNSPSTEISIQQILQSSSSVLDIVQADTTSIATTTVSNRCVLFIFTIIILLQYFLSYLTKIIAY
ncbi:unnamed protein product [Rotaria socialis]|uniref:Uncharacterized protein n=1 Tax=Rotaria socialis TaxID=392032 RepID=A0A818RWR7_9BILA|nr:unnamed protein product [Rotaria socialis]CAF4897439.1 unnamed protein product [Rotaria socialis]